MGPSGDIFGKVTCADLAQHIKERAGAVPCGSSRLIAAQRLQLAYQHAPPAPEQARGRRPPASASLGQPRPASANQSAGWDARVVSVSGRGLALTLTLTLTLTLSLTLTLTLYPKPGVVVDRKLISVPAIKGVGSATAKLALHKEVAYSMTLKVVADLS